MIKKKKKNKVINGRYSCSYFSENKQISLFSLSGAVRQEEQFY